MLNDNPTAAEIEAYVAAGLDRLLADLAGPEPEPEDPERWDGYN